MKFRFAALVAVAVASAGVTAASSCSLGGGLLADFVLWCLKKPVGH